LAGHLLLLLTAAAQSAAQAARQYRPVTKQHGVAHYVCMQFLGVRRKGSGAATLNGGEEQTTPREAVIRQTNVLIDSNVSYDCIGARGTACACLVICEALFTV
jgi:hypothetical protein